MVVTRRRQECGDRSRWRYDLVPGCMALFYQEGLSVCPRGLGCRIDGHFEKGWEHEQQ